MVDRDGTVWRFPHQHQLHYSRKISQLHFAPGAMSGYFGEPAPMGYPVVIVDESDAEPSWAICDMYYDLHCLALVTEQVQPGQSWRFKYRVKYLDEAEAGRLLAQSRPIAITLTDWEEHNLPRIELGMNTFTNGVNIDRPDDASAFRPNPPQLVWDRQQGHREKGALRITNVKPEETLWSAVPPTQIPSEVRLNITAMVKTAAVRGKGAFIRVRYHTFTWQPTPHIEWTATLESAPVTGDTDGWVKITVPELKVPPEHFDYLIWLDVVLDGEGVAWITDVDVDQQSDAVVPPALEEGSSRRTSLPVRSRKSAGATL